MSKKDYIKFAQMIKARVELLPLHHDNEFALFSRCNEIINIAVNLANIFQDDNPQFDRERFLKACGL